MSTLTKTRPESKKFTTFKNTSTARQQTLQRKLARKIKYGGK